MMGALMQRMKEHKFLFEELAKRDFKQKYKRTMLGMVWSILNPLLTLLVMSLVFSYYREATSGGMSALMSNAHIFTKINVPKYLFVLTKNISAVINFGLTLVVFFIFAAIDGITFHWSCLAIIYPIVTMTLLNIGLGMILSALFVFFRDIQYIYDVFTLLLMYLSAIFYTLDKFPPQMQRLFLLNPIYCNIKYIRIIVIEGTMPSLLFHGLLLLYSVVILGIGLVIYKTQNTKFLYYV